MFRSVLQVYVKDSINAVEFYREVFDAPLMADHKNKDGTYYEHAELDVYGQTLALMESSAENVIKGNTMQFFLHFGEGKEAVVHKIYDNLKDGAEIFYPLSPCDWSPLMTDLVDKYGVRWLIAV
ncbi:MAG: VOC family protein [Firmicutes bacterium]|nr:VOC family protein [Bacillota bacterium]